MTSVVTSRLDENVKRRSIEILSGQGITLSAAVQGLFDYVVEHERLPYETTGRHRDVQEARAKLAALAAARVPEDIAADAPSDEDVKLGRLEERYGLALR